MPAHHFHQRLQWHWIHEVGTEHAPGIGSQGRKPGDRNATGVDRVKRVGSACLAQLRVHPSLDCRILRNAFYYPVDVLQCRVVERADNSRKQGFGVKRWQFAAHQLVAAKRPPKRAAKAIEDSPVDILQHHVVAERRERQADIGAHYPGADHSNACHNPPPACCRCCSRLAPTSDLGCVSVDRFQIAQGEHRAIDLVGTHRPYVRYLEQGAAPLVDMALDRYLARDPVVPDFE